MQRIGNALRMLRESRGISQRTIADELHISEASYSRWESGLVQVRLSDLPALKKAFGIRDWGTLLDALGMTPGHAYQPAAEFVAESRMARLPELDEDAPARRRAERWRSRGRIESGDTSADASADTSRADEDNEPPTGHRGAVSPGSHYPRSPSVVRRKRELAPTG